MTGKEIVDAIPARAGASKKDTIAVIARACCDYRHCHERRPVRFTGFGTFKSRKKPAHAGHNPVNGATIDIPASTVPVFRTGKAFKDTEEATESRAYRTEVLQAPLLRIK